MKPLGLDDAGLKIEGLLHQQIQKALTELFETKQLYQSVAVDLTALENFIGGLQAEQRRITLGSRTGIEAQLNHEATQKLRASFRAPLNWLVASEWLFDSHYYPQRTPTHNQGAGPVFFRTPTIKVACNFCDAVLPAHNSGFDAWKDRITSVDLGNGSGGRMQALAFPFMCQSCKKHPVVYLVTRRGLKFTLSGRSEFPKVDVSKVFPSEERDYFSKALISRSAGHTLAGILYLRVFVEQYLRRVTGASGRKTGDELGELYRPILHEDFPKSFKSLAKVYENLSEKLHDADASEGQFDASRSDIEQHFRQLELLPLKTRATQKPEN